MSQKAAKRQKFCASCFNYINSCDCLGNLDDHAHLTDFETTGKDDDEPEESDDVWYFRAEIGPTLLTVGNIGLMGLLSMKEMWTTDPPANPSLYLSIPKDRLPMSAVNVNSNIIGKPQLIAPKTPWEIPFFELEYYKPQGKSDEQIEKERKDCEDDAEKKGKSKRKCFFKYLWNKAQQKLTVTEDDLKYAVSQAVDVSAIEGYYGAFVFAKPFVPPRLWNLANNSVVPGCGHGWIEQDLIDGGDPAKDLDCSGLLLSNVPGAEDFWKDNQNGTNGPNPYDGGVTTPFSTARMLTMPHVPPPVPRDDQLPCSKLQYNQGKCEPPDDPPPPYIPPPITKPPTGPPIVPPEPPIDPPIDTLLPGWTITPNAVFNMAMVQVHDKTRSTWYNSGSTGFPDDRSRPHLAWGSPAVPWTTGEVLNITDMQFRVPPAPLNGIGIYSGPYEWCTLRIFCANGLANPNQLFQLKLVLKSGSEPITGNAFEITWEGSNGIDLNGPSSKVFGNSVTSSFRKSVKAGIEFAMVRIRPLHKILPNGSVQDWKIDSSTNWDIQAKPVFKRASDMVWDTSINGGVTPTFDPANGRMILSASNVHPTSIDGTFNYGIMRSDGIRVIGPNMSFINGEVVVSHNIGAQPSIGVAQVHKGSNTGDGGLTPVQAGSGFRANMFGVDPGQVGTVTKYAVGTANIQGSFSGYFGIINNWTK